MVKSVTQVIKTRRSNEYFEKCIWKPANEIAEHANIAIAPSSRRTRLPTRYQDCHVLECTGGRSDNCMSSVSQTYRVIYFSVIDKVVIELEQGHFPIMSCGSHVAKNHRKHLETLKKQNCFTKPELGQMKKVFPIFMRLLALQIVIVKLGIVSTAAAFLTISSERLEAIFIMGSPDKAIPVLSNVAGLLSHSLQL